MQMLLIDKEITLRAIEEKDSILLKEMINDPELEYLVLGWSLPVSNSRQLEWIKNLSSNELKFIIDVNDTGIGMASITNLDYKNSTASVNIKIKNSNDKGKGYGTRVIKLLINYCFNELNLNCLTANILEYNIASQKLFEKCGFIKDGILRSRIFKRGCYHNVYSYSLLRDEFLNA